MPLGVRRRAQDQGPRVVAQRGAHRFLGDLKLRRRERQVLRFEAGDDGRVEVVAVVGLHQQNAVAGVQQRVDGRRERPAGADRHDNLSFGIGLNLVVARKLARDRLAELGHAFGVRVRRGTLVDGALRCFDDRRWQRRVAEALAEVDAADPVALAGHAADVRLHQVAEALAAK